MKHISTFPIFESTAGLTEEQMRFLDVCTTGRWTYDKTTGLVDVDSFNCSMRPDVPDFKGIKFGKSQGNFNCSREGFRSGLKSLAGAPQTVGGNFDCSYNRGITSLVGGPQTVRGGFSCRSNSLESLTGAPQTVGGNFNCHDNDLKTLEGAPLSVGGYFDCEGNNLTSLAGAPDTITGMFYSNRLKVGPGEWNFENLLRLFMKTTTAERRDLLKGILSPEVLQQKIDENPEKMAVELKSLLKLPQYASLKFPARLQKEVDLIRDLSDVGL